MKLLEVFKSQDKIQLDKKTLVILRWIALIGQFVTIYFVFFILKYDFPFFYCCLIISIMLLGANITSGENSSIIFLITKEIEYNSIKYS